MSRSLSLKDIENRPNYEIRKSMIESGLSQYEIAHRIGIDESRLCVWLRYELSHDDERRKRILLALEGK